MRRKNHIRIPVVVALLLMLIMSMPMQALASTNDPFYSLQWGLSNDEYHFDISFEAAKDFIDSRKTGMSKTVVAVIDTGFDYNHPDLKNSVWVNTGEIAGNGKDDDKNGYIDDVYGYDFAANKPLASKYSASEYNHGTHCAGTIAATSDNGVGICGIGSISDSVSLMNLKVLSGNEGLGDTEGLIKAIKYAEANGADICNLSMGSYSNDPELYKVIAHSDMLFVCAAGNEGYNLNYKPMYPGSYDLNNVLCVGNMRATGSLLKLSNYSDKLVDIAAPGTHIYSTGAGNTYLYMDGTSMAAPFVTGIAALAHSYYYGISASEIRQLIIDTADITDKLQGKVLSSGYANCYKVLSYKSKEYYSSDNVVPELSATISTIQGSYKQIISITASDESGDIPTVSYARGNHAKSYFANGKGYAIKTDSLGVGSKIASIPGIYTICATDASGNMTVVNVMCTSDAVRKITLSSLSKSIKTNESFTLKAKLSDTGKYGRTLSYSSSDSSIAKVSANGKVTGLKKGMAVITVKTSNLLKATCTVTVK